MAARKMTFTLPAELAARFQRCVRARNRSRYVSAALAEMLNREEAQVIRACEIVNRDPGVRQIEKTFEELQDAIAEPWEDVPSR